MPEDRHYDVLEVFEANTDSSDSMLGVVTQALPAWLIEILKKEASERDPFELECIQQADSTGLLPSTVWWYPSSWSFYRREPYWKYLVKTRKFSQLELIIEQRLSESHPFINTIFK